MNEQSSGLLTHWVKQKHQGQLVKGTYVPYFTHLAAVAALAGSAIFLGYEAGLCHDLLEDTATSRDELLAALIGFGYSQTEANKVTTVVIELTDVFTRTAYPGWSKKRRKEQEALRLYTVSPAAQTVKYADLIDNIRWVLKHDQAHATAYLEKKELLVAGMTMGDPGLRTAVFEDIYKGIVLMERHDRN